MASRRCVTVSLGPELLEFAAALIASGRCGSVSEVVRAPMRDLEERELRFRDRRRARRTGVVQTRAAVPDEGAARA